MLCGVVKACQFALLLLALRAGFPVVGPLGRLPTLKSRDGNLGVELKCECLIPIAECLTGEKIARGQKLRAIRDIEAKKVRLCARKVATRSSAGSSPCRMRT